MFRTAIFKRLYSTKPKTFYDLFPVTFPKGGPPNTAFRVDKNALRREFLNLQSTHHPDRARPGDQTSLFADKSAQLNNAYKALLDPLRRAEHILLSKGIDALAEKDTLTEEDLLMEVLMAREAISEAHNQEDVDQIKKENEERISEAERILEDAFKSGDLDTAGKEVVKLSYWQSIAKQIHDLH